ncbi:hypothetical protein GXN76_05195 [Kroppenstedtia pulmonis]|uniref:Uncharacterized protein n=1 Tax=Kroppenstedtia pulmonis TaxID=1380685 RepID=A0A7D4BPB9_9BACL|nr:YlbF family regulator [Kroppenstedtia pulmonis]QKG83931.1 hypothetical protein GXN76_05195 [Kroppenstedtia pulmonis]
MNPYDKAHELAGAIRRSEEFRQLLESWDGIKDVEDRGVLDRYRELQMEYQVQVSQGKEVSGDSMRELEVLMKKIKERKDLSRVLEAEARIGTLMGDINRIVTEPLEKFYHSHWKK